MSQRFCSFSIPEDYETIQNKSIQGKIFNNSAFYNLQGDNELVDRSSLNSLSICKDRNQISILDHTHSQQLGQMSENRQIEDIFLDQNSSKSKASERPLSNKQVLQVELFESISNQIQEVPNKEGNKNQNISLKNNLQDKKSSTYSVQNQINSNFMQESPNLSQKQNVNQSYDLNFIQTPIKNQEFGRINDSSSSRNARQTIFNYQKAASIVNKILNNSMNRVQRIFFCSSQVDSEFIKCFFLYAFILFILDGLVNLNTAYFSQDAIVLNRRQIISRYLKSYIFLTDMISLFVMGAKVVIPTQSLIYNPQNNLILFSINFLIFLKLNGIQKKRNSFSQVFTLKENQKHMLRLFNQLLTVISVAHIVSLAWYYLGVYEIQSGYSITWLEKFNMLELSYIEKYIYSMYWSITTMTTVGYGDIVASNSVEALFIEISMIIFSCVFAYSINNIGFILQEIEKSSKQLNDNITTIQRLRIKQNIEISKILQENLRNLNSYTQLLFETNIEILSECSVKIYKESEQEYSSDSYQSSLNGEQISQTSITDKFKNDQHLSSQGDLKKQYKKGKTQKSVKKTKTTVKQDESFKNIITSLKDVQSNEYSHNQEKNNILNNSKQRNKVTLTQVDNSEKIIQSMEQQIEIGKEENKNLTAESIITQKLSYLNEKNTSSDLEENININQSQKVIKHRQSINNQDTNMNQRARKKQKNLSFQINQKQISNNSDIIQNLNFIEDLKSNQNNIKQQQQQQQQYNCKKNSFLQVNDLSLRPSIDFQLSNLSLKQFFEGYEMNQNYEDNFQKFEEFIKSQLTSPISSDPNIMNKIFFEYLLQNIKKKNSFTVEQKLSPSQKNSYQLLQSMESQINQALEQNKKQLFGQATQNDQQQHSNLSENFDKIKKCQTKLGYTSCLSSIKPQFQQQFERADIQSENYYLICKTIFEKFDVIKNFKKFYPHNNFENVISKYKLIKSNSKKNKNSKIQSKERRQNVLMQPIISRKSQFFNNLALANLPSLANQDSYKPTYLSYGISQRNDSIYPKQFQHQNQNNLIQK
ncbi:hypothetical protein ABPG74_007441 [Tetrahymena malaccensis]